MKLRDGQLASYGALSTGLVVPSDTRHRGRTNPAGPTEGRVKKALAGAIIVGSLLVGCGDSDDPTVSDPRVGSPAEQADAYALDLAGRRTGCASTDAPSEERKAGCTFSAAYAGCYKGITGKDLGPLPFEKEFPEPEHQAIYRTAIEDCEAP